MNYAQIKAEAKRRGCNSRDLIALAFQHDPYFQGQPAAVKMADWFAKLWKEGEYPPGTALRAIHYRLASTPRTKDYRGRRYQNTTRCFDELIMASKHARYLGLVSIDDIEDAKTPGAQIHAHESIGYQSTVLGTPSVEVHIPQADIPHLGSNYELQPFHLKAWIEKTTMDDELTPVCARYEANLQSGKGHMSLSRVNDLVQRVRERGKAARVFYISDFDPGGADMPTGVSRKIEWLVRERYEGDCPEIKLMHLALTAQQVEHYNLPRIPANPNHSAKARFEREHGQGAVELDALEALYPGELASLVQAALSDYWDDEIEDEASDAAETIRAEVQTRIDSVVERHSKTLKRVRDLLRPLNSELRGIGGQDCSEMAPDPLGPDDVPGDNERPWLYDSARDYWEQLAAYKEQRAAEGGQ